MRESVVNTSGNMHMRRMISLIVRMLLSIIITGEKLPIATSYQEQILYEVFGVFVRGVYWTPCAYKGSSKILEP